MIPFLSRKFFFKKKYIMLLLNKSDYVMFDQTIDKLYNIAEKNNLLN